MTALLVIAATLGVLPPSPTAPAQRLDIALLAANQDPVPVPGDCESYKAMAFAAGWTEPLWPRLKQILWRESRCNPDARSRTRDTGIAQINDIVTRDSKIAAMVGQRFTPADLYDPLLNLTVARALCDYGVRYHRRGGCWWAWSTS